MVPAKSVYRICWLITLPHTSLGLPLDFAGAFLTAFLGAVFLAAQPRRRSRKIAAHVRLVFGHLRKGAGGCLAAAVAAATTARAAAGCAGVIGPLLCRVLICSTAVCRLGARDGR